LTMVYDVGFEKARIGKLTKTDPMSESQLLSTNERIVDLLPVARNHFYRTKQQGSWSIEKVLQVVALDQRYDKLHRVQDGCIAISWFVKNNT